MTIPLTLVCPEGEEWPATSFQCLVDITVDVMKPRNIHFFCPAHHDFTLARALKAKMFTGEQGQRILEGAQKLQASLAENPDLTEGLSWRDKL